jgi:hypothetical protein
MEQLDLNIDNYSIKDIENFLQIEPNTTYTMTELTNKYNTIKEKINVSNIDLFRKFSLFQFLDKANDILIAAKLNNKNQNLAQNESSLTKSIINNSSKDKNMITHPETQYNYTNPSDFFPGKLNPLNNRILSTYVIIDSRFRDNFNTTNSNDFYIYLPTRLTKVVSMQLSSFEFPVSFYGISANYGNNFFSITVKYLNNNTELTEKRDFTVPDGNYNPFKFIQLVNDVICPKDEDGNILNPDDIFSYIVATLDLDEDTSSGTGKVTFKTSGTFAVNIISFSLDFTRKSKTTDCFETNLPITTRIGYNLGFLKDKYEGTDLYISETIIEPATIRYVYLVIDDFNNNVNNNFIPAYFNSTTFSKSIIAKISVKGPYFSLLMEDDLNIITEPRKYFGPVDIQKLRITLLDDHGRILDMTNANYSFCLIFKQLYDL